MIGIRACLKAKWQDKQKAQMTGRRMSMAISHEAPYEETDMFSENPSACSSTEPYGFTVVSYMKMQGKESTGGTCIRPYALSHYSHRVQPFPDYIQAPQP